MTVAINYRANSCIVPDFRSSTGLFKSLKTDHKLKASGKQLFDASVYQTDSSTSTFHDMVRSMSELVKEARPTAFHNMLSDLALEGKLLRLYTQNVDGLDVELPCLHTDIPLSNRGPWPPTIQLHGGLAKMTCSKCSHVSDFDPSLFNGPEPPPCTFCVEADRVRTDHAGKRSHGVGRLRPRMVLYNEQNPDEDAIGSVTSADLRARPDAIIVVGTSMKIPGVRRIVKEMCNTVRDRRDGLSVWINRDPPPPGKDFEDCWDLVVKGPCDEVANQFHLSREIHKACTESDVEAAKERGEYQVMVPSPTKEFAQMLTPAPSPAPKPLEVKKTAPLKLKISPSKSKDKKAPGGTKASTAGKAKNPTKAVSKSNAKATNTKKSQQKRPPNQLTSTFKVTKSSNLTSTSTTTKLKPKSTSRSGTSTPKPSPKKSAIQHPSSSSPLSSPPLPSYKPSPLTPSKARNNGTPTSKNPQGALFPGLIKLPPLSSSSKPSRPDPLTQFSLHKSSRARSPVIEVQVPKPPYANSNSYRPKSPDEKMPCPPPPSSPPSYSPLSSPVLGPIDLEPDFSVAELNGPGIRGGPTAEGEVESEESLATAAESFDGTSEARSYHVVKAKVEEQIQLQTPPDTQEEGDTTRPHSSSSLSSARSWGSSYERMEGTISPSAIPNGMGRLLHGCT